MKQIYFVITNMQRWGKSTSLKKALELAGIIKLPGKTSKVEFNIHICVLKQETTEEELQNIAQCYSVNGMGGITFYEGNGEIWIKDREMAERLLVGWINDTTSFNNFKG